MRRIRESQLTRQIHMYVRALFVCIPPFVCGISLGAVHQVHFFPNGNEPATGTGELRIINHSAETGKVTVVAIDDAGSRSDATSFTIAAEGITTLTASDLENGNSSLELTGIGRGQGSWRLELTTELDLEILSYVVGTNGQINPMQIPVFGKNGRFRVSLSNRAEASIEHYLRLINRSADGDVFVTVSGRDDTGQLQGPVIVEVGPGGARQVAISDLENGGEGFTGHLDRVAKDGL